jgi:HKD family nuclease
MSWHLQTPDGGSPKLLANILAGCGDALKGGAAFAFASAQGVKLLAAEKTFSKFLKAGEFTLVVGLDAITDVRAIDELKKLQKSHPNLKPKLFLHSVGGSLFHPKTMWLKTSKGGVIITGSGNLTAGGLKSNWEAMAIQTLDAAEIAAAEKSWDEWLNTHKKELRDLDDPKAGAKAEANKKLRAKIKRVIKAPDIEADDIEPDVEAVADTVEEIEQELKLNPMLIAEIPKASDRWEQVNFDNGFAFNCGADVTLSAHDCTSIGLNLPHQSSAPTHGHTGALPGLLRAGFLNRHVPGAKSFPGMLDWKNLHVTQVERDAGADEESSIFFIM